MAKIKVSELAQLNADRVNEETSLLAVDSQQSYQLKYGFLSANLSSNLYRPLAETVSAECDIQQQKDDISNLTLSCNNLSDEIKLSVNALTSSIDNKLDKDTVATEITPGLVKLGYQESESEANRCYSLQLDQDNKAYVKVPWQPGQIDDPRLTVLLGVSSYYSYDLDDELHHNKDKVKELSTSVNKLSANVEELNTLSVSQTFNEIDEQLSEIASYTDDGILSSGYILELSSKVKELSTSVNSLSANVEELNTLSVSQTFNEIDEQLSEIASYTDDGILSSGYILELSSIVSSLYDDIYPIGSIYTTINNTVPNKLQSFEWEKLNLSIDIGNINFFKRIK